MSIASSVPRFFEAALRDLESARLFPHENRIPRPVRNLYISDLDGLLGPHTRSGWSRHAALATGRWLWFFGWVSSLPAPCRDL